MKKLCELVGKYFGVVILLFFIGGMTYPPAFTWVLGKISGFSILSFMLGVIMFGMGYNYNGKLRSAELLLREDGSVKLIRRAEESKDYFATFDFSDEFKDLR